MIREIQILQNAKQFYFNLQDELYKITTTTIYDHESICGLNTIWIIYILF